MLKENSKIKKIVLAYSGGLDTSVILKWLQDNYQCDVVTFTADIGQGEEVEPARNKAESLGVKEILSSQCLGLMLYMKGYIYLAPLLLDLS